MKRQITLSIALVLSIVLVSLMNSDSTVKAQNQIRIIADTGVVRLGPNQKLRLSVVSVDGELGGGIYGVRFRQINYSTGVCSDGICKHNVESQTTSDLISLAPGEALGFDHIGNFNFRGIVLSNSRNLKVNAMIINTVTGEVEAVQMSMQRENQ